MKTTLPRRLHTTAVLPSLLRLTKALPGESPPAILVYPGKDLQGDVIDPDGGHWEQFEKNGRLVNFEHAYPVGTGRVEMKSIDIDGQWVNLPVGTTTFFTKASDLRGLKLPRYDGHGNVIGKYSADDCLRYAEQVAPLVLNGTMDGVSVEFRPRGPEGVAYKALGASPYLDRPACHFHEWDGLGWAAACRQPVNNNARYLKAFPDDLLARAEKAQKALKSNTLPLIRKSLSPLVAVLESRLKVVPVRTPVLKKAGRYDTDEAPEIDNEVDMEGMGDDMGGDDTETPIDPTPGDMATEPTPDLNAEPMADDMAQSEPQPPPSVAAGTDAAQSMIDAGQMVSDGLDAALSVLQMSDNPAARNKMKALAEEARKEIQSVVKRHAAKLQKAADALAAKLASGDEQPVDDDAMDGPADVDTDESGMVIGKAFPAYIPQPRRHRKSELRPPVKRAKVAPKATDEEARRVELMKELISLSKHS